MIPALLPPHFNTVIVDVFGISATLAPPPATYTLYYVVLPATDAKPTAEAIKLHSDHVMRTTPGDSPIAIFLITPPPPGSYRFHAFFEDSAAMASSDVSSSDEFTVALPPGAVAAPQLGAPSVVGTTVTVSAT